MDIIEFIRNLTVQVSAIAWVLFFLSWIIGWAIRGSPVPFIRIKRTGQDIIEDSVIAAFWLAMGSSVFAIIAYLVSMISIPFPEPPMP